MDGGNIISCASVLLSVVATQTYARADMHTFRSLDRRTRLPNTSAHAPRLALLGQFCRTVHRSSLRVLVLPCSRSLLNILYQRLITPPVALGIAV